MDMQMRHAFASIRSAVDHDSITTGKLQLFRHVARNQEQFAKQRGILVARIRKTGNGFFRHDQDMHWRLGLDVVKRNRVVIFPDDFGRNLPRDDFLENRHER